MIKLILIVKVVNVILYVRFEIFVLILKKNKMKLIMI